VSARARHAAWFLIVAAIPSAGGCGGGPVPGPPGNRDTISLEDAGGPVRGVGEPATTVAERDTLVERDTPAETDTTKGAAEADSDAVADTAPQATGSWSAGVVDLPSGAAGISTLVSVRTARHEGFDRVVWELEGDMPGIHVEYVDEPVRSCGSGEPVALTGDAWLEVRITPANAHSEAGRPTIAERRRATGLPAVHEIVQTCDFEGIVTWVLAVRSPETFRLARFGDPSRLVVDVRHRQ